MSLIKNKEEISKIRKSGVILSATLKKLRESAKIGVSLLELDEIAKNTIEELGGKPAFLNYFPYGAKKPYPKTLCASMNQVIVHGVPTNRRIKSGDVVKLDLGVVYDSYYSDAAFTLNFRDSDQNINNLVKAAEEALYAGIKSAKSGNFLGDIGFAISEVAKKYNMTVIRGLGGHGIGKDLHEDPFIDNFGEQGKGIVLKENMVLAIEPMFSIGSEKISILPDDSYKTSDDSISAHFEHTILITKRGGEILTK